jgi:catechol 2,3-dioxygenase-like lactoylglutathione lyase family enzyme
MPPGREAEARAFYVDVLGIPEVVKPPHLARRGGCWFEDASVRVHLGVEADFRPVREATRRSSSWAWRASWRSSPRRATR